MKVSIITTTYNAEKYISETIKSVLFQDFSNFEYIIIDDCSTDTTVSIVRNHKDLRIKVHCNEKNLWIVGSRNKWLSLAQWEYVCFLDHDDIWHSQQKLLKQVCYMDKYKDVWIVWSYCVCFEWNKDIEWLRFWVSDEKIRSNILVTNQFATCSVMIRKSVLEKVWYLDPIYEKVDDYDLRLRIGVVAKFANIPEFLVKYRYHSMNTTKQRDNLKKMRYMTISIIKKYRNIYPNALLGIFLQYMLLYIPTNLFWFIRKKLLGT